MKPLSPWIYYWRHRGQTLLLIGLISLATLGIYAMVSVLDSIPMRARYSYLTRVSRVYPAAGEALEPGTLSRIQTHPGVAQVIADNGLSISPPTLIGRDSTRLMGVSRDDAQVLMAQCGLRLKEGRMLEPRTNEIVLSEEVVRALDLQIGDQIDRSVDQGSYGALSAPLVLVGVLEGDPTAAPGASVTNPSVRAGFASYEYLSGHELYAPRIPSLLVIADKGHKAAVDEYLETEIASARTEVETYRQVSELARMALRGIHVILIAVDCLVAVVVALVVGVINRIALTHRLAEFGLLQALGFRRQRLMGRLTLEAAGVAAVGGVIGLILSGLALAWLKAGPYHAIGMELDLTNRSPLWFVAPIPMVVVAFAARSARRAFAGFDPVAIVERGKLVTEGERPERAGRGPRTARRSSRPLSSVTFYLRHRRRSVALVISTALMVLGVALPVFLGSTLYDATEPRFEYLRYVARVSPGMGQALEPGVVARIRSHPAVARVVPVRSMGVGVLVPPGGGSGANIYAVAVDELPDLLALFGMDLVEGRLPGARSNEIALSEGVARNRRLRVGDRMGRPVWQGQESDPLISDDLPVEMVVVGLLSGQDLWLGFASLAFLESHELLSSRPTEMLLVPTDGHKTELDAWLEGSVASPQTEVHTYGGYRRQARQSARAMLLLFAAVESIIAVVAAAALAALNYVFFTQRREEFGILSAIGRSRRWLIWRTVRESGGLLALAWFLGAAVCVATLLFARINIYAPMGLRLDLTNLTPWLFTLPIPVAVVAASGGTIYQMLSRLDPVSVIERR